MHKSNMQEVLLSFTCRLQKQLSQIVLRWWALHDTRNKTHQTRLLHLSLWPMATYDYALHSKSSPPGPSWYIWWSRTCWTRVPSADLRTWHSHAWAPPQQIGSSLLWCARRWAPTRHLWRHKEGHEHALVVHTPRVINTRPFTWSSKYSTKYSPVDGDVRDATRRWSLQNDQAGDVWHAVWASLLWVCLSLKRRSGCPAQSLSHLAVYRLGWLGPHASMLLHESVPKYFAGVCRFFIRSPPDSICIMQAWTHSPPQPLTWTQLKH